MPSSRQPVGPAAPQCGAGRWSRTISPRLPAWIFAVADLGLADFGRKEISLAEHEMPGLMAMRAPVRRAQAARRRQDRRIAAHDGADRRADRDPGRARRRRALGQLQHLLHPGPRRRRDRRRPGRHPGRTRTGVPVFAWKGETLEEYWWCTEQILSWPDGELANMILDDGGDATLLVHKGVEFSKAGEVPEPTEDDSEECQVVLRLLKRSIAEGRDWTAVANALIGRHRGDHHRRPPAVRDASQRARCCSRRSTSTTRSPSPSSTTSTAAGTP